MNFILLFSYESGILEDPKTHAPEDIYQMTTDPRESPKEADKLEITFKKGHLVLLRKWAYCRLLIRLSCEGQELGDWRGEIQRFGSLPLPEHNWVRYENKSY